MSGKVFVASDVTDHGYVATLSVDADQTRVLTPAESIRYAAAVLDAAARAEYDGAVFAQMSGIDGIGTQSAAMLVLDLRKDRPPLDGDALTPLGLEPSVNPEGKPFLVVSIAGEKVGQWTPAEARGHALNVLEVVAAVDLDSAYYRLLRGIVGLDEHRARNIVSELGNHRPEGRHEATR